MTKSEAHSFASREEKKAAQRQRILEAAKVVFFRDGFMEANLDEVAQRAGVAKGTLYRYFESKADLYVAVLSHNGRVFEDRMRDAARAVPDARDQLREVGRFYIAHWTERPEYFQIFWALENAEVIGGLPQAVVDEVVRLWESCLRILAGVIERGIEQQCFRSCDAWEVANILWTTANGLIQTEQVPPRRDLRARDLDKTFDHMIELVLAGLREGAGSPPRE